MLNELFGKVYIPRAVFGELTRNSLFVSEAQEVKNCEYIEAVEVEDKKSVRILRRATGLDAGESEAIILTEEQQGNILLMDEMKGRTVAKQMGIKIMGTIGILVIALEKRKITYSEIVQSIDILRDSGRHIKNELYEELLRAAEKFR